MRKPMLSAAIFVVAFCCSYLGLCYLVPGLRIKLFADAATYFYESIRHMVLFKGVLSLVIGSALAGIPFLVERRRGN